MIYYSTRRGILQISVSLKKINTLKQQQKPMFLYPKSIKPIMLAILIDLFYKKLYCITGNLCGLKSRHLFSVDFLPCCLKILPPKHLFVLQEANCFSNILIFCYKFLQSGVRPQILAVIQYMGGVVWKAIHTR